MPITDSAKKALRQNKKRRERNLTKMAAVKKEIKTLRKFTAAKDLPAGRRDKKNAVQALSKVYKAIDKAVKTNVIPKNRANRMKSQLTKAINKL